MTTTTPSILDRIAALDWASMTKDLDSFGCTIVKSVLTREECSSLAAMYERDDIFRSTIVMARHGFGRGEYKYWSRQTEFADSPLRRPTSTRDGIA